MASVECCANSVIKTHFGQPLVRILLLIIVADLDECAVPSHACTCSGLLGCISTCTNSIGSYTCGCNTGFEINVAATDCLGLCLHQP
jgi:hypothetical protein